MKKLAILVLFTALAAFAATNKNLPGAKTVSGNDRPVIQSISDSLVGAADTGFIACGIGATYCTTNMFNSIRYPLWAQGMPNPSSVIAKNPDSIVCNFVVIRKDADTGDGSAGIYLNIGTSASPVWTLYGSTPVAVPTPPILTKHRVTIPWAEARQFRPWITVTTATDTTRVRFVECKDLVNP